MTTQDEVLIAITVYRENRGGGYQGMQSVANVIQNRAAKARQSPYAVCTRHAQFSSISMPGPESYLWPAETDTQWQTALTVAATASDGTLADITGGATSYYAPEGMPGGQAPSWAASMTQTVTIANQLFFK
jgi:spore germination cell wall hydrolase CwlJ-like protein